MRSVIVAGKSLFIIAVNADAILVLICLKWAKAIGVVLFVRVIEQAIGVLHTKI